MINLQFPKLEKALSKTKKLKSDDPRNGIIVLDEKAIVFSDNYCLVVDLYEYFTIDCGIDDDLEVEQLKNILFYMDSKVFNKEFWTELTKGANMKMSNGLISIETPKYAKDLHYKDMDIDLLQPLKDLTKVSQEAMSMLSVVSIPFEALNNIYETLKSDFKGDYIILEFTKQDRPVRFTFRNRKHFYGYILPDYDSANVGFRFENLNNMVEDKSTINLIEELEEERKSKTPPPPPSEDGVVQMPDPSQADLFNENEEE